MMPHAKQAQAATASYTSRCRKIRNLRFRINNNNKHYKHGFNTEHRSHILHRDFYFPAVNGKESGGKAERQNEG
jgi:hypothetical protein